MGYQPTRGLTHLKTFHLIAFSLLVFVGAAKGALLAVPYLDSVGGLVGMSPVITGSAVPPSLFAAAPGTPRIDYKVRGTFFGLEPSVALEATNHEQRDFDEVIEIMTDTPGDWFQEGMWNTQARMETVVFRPPPVVILPPPVENPNMNLPPHIQLDTLDLSPGAQVDMRTVPADMLPGR